MKSRLALFSLALVGTGAVCLYAGRSSLKKAYLKINPPGYTDVSRYEGNKGDAEWSQKIMAGGYILHFRHAERQKWIDVQMYDALESDVHNNGPDQSRLAENDYFKDAVCLNSRGLIQAKAMGEHLSRINFPIGLVVSSPSCRARQTADLAFGGFSELNRDLVHIGPYKENLENRVNIMKDFYQNVPITSGKNTIVSAHNSVVLPQIFKNYRSLGNKISLEEGGFYVISRNEDTNELTLEHEFHNFNSFNRQFYPR